MQRARGLGEIVLGHLEIVPVSDGRCVADPQANDVRGMLGFQFCLPAGSQVVRDSRPLNQAGFLDDPSQVCSQVLRRCSLAMDDEFLHIAYDKSNPEWAAMEGLTKGLEIQNKMMETY